MRRVRLALPALLAIGLGACSQSRSDRASSPNEARKAAAAEVPAEVAAEAAAFAAPGQLTATLADAASIDLTWEHRATEEGGNWIEFATPDADFVKLDAAWPRTTTFRHPGLAPSNTYIYRLLPFFGRASEVVAIATEAAPRKPPSDSEGPLEEPGPAVLEQVRTQRAGGTLPPRSVRTRVPMAGAASTGLTAALSSPVTVDLRWRDRAADEEGTLVEISQDGTDFQICALLPPDTTSFRKTGLPPQTMHYFRVRPFFYGKPSRLVSVTTPAQAAPRAARQTAR